MLQTQPPYSDSQSVYQVPQPANIPQPVYQVPQPVYQVPQPVYAPQPNYAAPQPNYIAPGAYAMQPTTLPVARTEYLLGEDDVW